MVAQYAELRRELGIVGCDQTAIAEAAQVFGRVKTEAACQTDRAGASAFVFRANRLASVLDDRDAASRIGNLLNITHRGALPEQVDRNDRLGIACDLINNVGRIEV